MEGPLERIYREDELLAHRNLAFLTASSFLVIAFVNVLVASQLATLGKSLVELAIVGIGLFLSFFSVALGRRTVLAINFWRECENAGLKAEDVTDAALFSFYTEGSAVLPRGVIIVGKNDSTNIRGTPGSVRYAIPWRWSWVGSTNDVVGVLLPLSFAIFWMFLSFMVFPDWSFQVGVITVPSSLLVGIGTAAVVVPFFIWMALTLPLRPQRLSPPCELLAVLGRGIELRNGKWVPTEDVSPYVLDTSGRPLHVPDFPSSDKETIVYLAGGGRMNVEAAASLLKKQPCACILGFARPARYLQTSGGPSESEPMSDLLEHILDSQAQVERWNIRYGGDRVESNTSVEVENAFRYAKEKGYVRIQFLTISPHLPRVRKYAEECRAKPEFSGIHFTYLASDSVLEMSDPKERRRIRRLRQSKEWIETQHYEWMGLRLNTTNGKGSI